MELLKKFIENANAKRVAIDSIIVEQNGKIQQCIINDIYIFMNFVLVEKC